MHNPGDDICTNEYVGIKAGGGGGVRNVINNDDVEK